MNSYNTDIYFLATTIICSLSTLNSLGGLLCQPHTMRKWSTDEEMVEIVSKETVVLRRWEIGKQELCLSTDHEAFVDHLDLTPYKVQKTWADVSSVGPSSEWLHKRGVFSSSVFVVIGTKM